MSDFTGYKLKELELTLDALVTRERLHFGEVKVRLTRIEQKIDALGQNLTPEERAAIIAQINDQASKITAIASGTEALADKLDETAK